MDRALVSALVAFVVLFALGPLSPILFLFLFLPRQPSLLALRRRARGAASTGGQAARDSEGIIRRQRGEFRGRDVRE